ncbi:MAG: rRNA maturation RNase YbeY [Planctomycetota bacterium]
MTPTADHESPATAGDDPEPASPSEDPPEPPSSAYGAGRPAALVVDITDATHRLDAGALRWLRAHATAAAVELRTSGEARVRVIADDEMAAAHERHLGIGSTTDVLTFDLSAGGDAVDADILVCLDEAARQADARGHDTARELLLYVIHGLLHCCGYDDADDASYARMHAREDEILAAIGVGATFARTDTEAAS